MTEGSNGVGETNILLCGQDDGVYCKPASIKQLYKADECWVTKNRRDVTYNFGIRETGIASLTK